MGKSTFTQIVALLLCACGDNVQPDLRCQIIELELPPHVNGWPFFDFPTDTDERCSLVIEGRPPYFFRNAAARHVNSWNLSDRDSGGGAMQMYCQGGKITLDMDSVLLSANLEVYFSRQTDSPSAARFDCKLTHRYYDYNAIQVRPGVCRPREDRDEGRDWPPYTPTLICLWERE